MVYVFIIRYKLVSQSLDVNIDCSIIFVPILCDFNLCVNWRCFWKETIKIKWKEIETLYQKNKGGDV